MDATPGLPIGQLLGRLLRSFRGELYRRARDGGYDDIREAHLQVFGAIDWRGTRLTDLAARAQMTLPSMSELVDELQRKGYLVRGADPTDGRAKRIRLTRKGRRFLAEGLRAVREMEAAYAAILGEERYAELRTALGELVMATGELSRGPSASDPPPARAGSRR